VMQTGGAAGMQTLESALKKRLDEGVIELDDAVKSTSRPKEFQLLLNSSPA